MMYPVFTLKGRKHRISEKGLGTMIVTVAIDSLKGSLTSLEAGRASSGWSRMRRSGCVPWQTAAKEP